MKARLVFIPLLPALLGPTGAAAQSLSGRVTDHVSGSGLPGVLIELVDTRRREAVSTTSGATGGFELGIPRTGSFVLRANRIGYQPFESDTLELRTHDVVQVALQLSVEPVALQPIVVRISGDSNLREFEQRRSRGAQGHFIAREDIERRPVATPSELLVGVPGVGLGIQTDLNGMPQDRYIVRLDGSGAQCTAHVFINGMPFTQTSHSTIDDLLNAESLAGVEVYRTAAAAPSEYRRPGCGSVLFWTRAPEEAGRWHWAKAAAVAGFVVLATVLTR